MCVCLIWRHFTAVECGRPSARDPIDDAPNRLGAHYLRLRLHPNWICIPIRILRLFADPQLRPNSGAGMSPIANWVLPLLLWLLCMGFPILHGADLCQPIGWRNFQCSEVASLQDLVDLGAENWHTLAIRNVQTELEVGSGEVGRKGLGFSRDKFLVQLL